MADSPSHKFGQIIGDVLEMTVEPILSAFAKKHGLYLDRRGPRKTRAGSKVSWIDSNGNKHDLDFVLERGGKYEKQGIPVAFIETAWRRYTKHSRNKAQEIQGAIMPLFETYRQYYPFMGAILAGVFTGGALKQLKSLGFIVAYFPYETVVQAFALVGIDASSEQNTPDAIFVEKCRQWNALEAAKKRKVSEKLARLNKDEITAFIEALHAVAMRTIKAVRIFPLHGLAIERVNIEEAIQFIREYKEEGESYPLVRYEVQIIYMNGDRISGEFTAKNAAIEFLKTYSILPEGIA